MKKVAVIQSNYVPWKGYFDIIHDVDLFVFYDDVQYTKNDWRNRNRIKTAEGLCWLTIPVGQREDRLICDVSIADDRWARKHWCTLKQYYSKAPHFKEYKDMFEYVYLERTWRNLSELNQFLIKTISREFLDIRGEFADSRAYEAQGQRLDRLIDLLQKVGATLYVSGPTARGYIDEDVFSKVGIELVYKEYHGYPQYAQQFPPFDHGVSVLDVLFNCGRDAPYFIWGWRELAGRNVRENTKCPMGAARVRDVDGKYVTGVWNESP
ncbi:MAG: WbqC family protein [Acidobacteriota bacterium]